MARETADLILRGDIWTPNPRGSWAEALAARGGKIVAVGPVSDISDLAGPRTRTVDLSGRLVLPGFQDSHVHPPDAGLEMIRCNLQDGTGPEDYFDRIRAYASAHPEAEWILGGGWALDHFPGGTPHRTALDVLV